MQNLKKNLLVFLIGKMESRGEAIRLNEIL